MPSYPILIISWFIMYVVFMLDAGSTYFGTGFKRLREANPIFVKAVEKRQFWILFLSQQVISIGMLVLVIYLRGGYEDDPTANWIFFVLFIVSAALRLKVVINNFRLNRLAKDTIEALEILETIPSPPGKDGG